MIIRNPYPPSNPPQTLCCHVISLYFPQVTLDCAIAAVVGMTSLAVAFVEGRLTMSFLVLETTGNFSLSLFMLAVAALVSVIVRRWTDMLLDF
jgi:chloride channel protein, CIC family